MNDFFFDSSNFPFLRELAPEVENTFLREDLPSNNATIFPSEKGNFLAFQISSPGVDWSAPNTQDLSTSLRLDPVVPELVPDPPPFWGHDLPCSLTFEPPVKNHQSIKRRLEELSSPFLPFLSTALPAFGSDLSEPDVYKYTTKSGRSLFKFAIFRMSDGEERIFVLSQPSYRGRAEGTHESHRYGLNRKNWPAPYICFDPPPRSFDDAVKILKTWSERTEIYIETGQGF